MADHLVVCDSLIKIYKVADLEVVALQGLDLTVDQGEMVAIVGASGSGKSTFLNIVGGLDAPTAGHCIVDGHDLGRFSDAQRSLYRQRTIGHLWQQSGRNLIQELTALENVELPQMIAGVSRAARRKQARMLLEQVGLGDKLHNYPRQLSGGEQQRAAIAVALSNDQPLLLADEPTGELDSETALNLIGLLHALNHERNLTVILVTHDVAVAAQMDRTIAIRDGRTSTETVRRDGDLAQVVAGSESSAIIGLSSETHLETILIDKVGRLQLPHDAIGRVPFGGRSVVRIFDDHVELWPVKA